MIYNFLIVIIILILVILFVVFFVELISKYMGINNGMKEYSVLLPIKDNGKNMNYCLNGCVRGMCNKSSDNSKDNCKYDFQCQYCQDKNTNMFYVDFNNNYERDILPVYEEDEKLNKSQTELLNDSIQRNNKYIDELNNKIKMVNQYT